MCEYEIIVIHFSAQKEIDLIIFLHVIKIFHIITISRQTQIFNVIALNDVQPSKRKLVSMTKMTSFATELYFYS